MATATVNATPSADGLVKDAVDQVDIGIVYGQGWRFAIFLLRLGHVSRVLALQIHGWERGVQVAQERGDLRR
ncbi:hypothetical protein D9M71_749600 [compost metagenome]